MKQSQEHIPRNYFRINFLVTLILFLIGGRILAQNVALPATSICLLGNTGVVLSGPNNLTQNQATIGSPDPRWQVSTFTSGVGPNATVISPPFQATTCLGWTANSSLPNTPATWITMPGLNCGSIAGNYSCTAPPINDLYFRLVIPLGPTPMLHINWLIFASDYVADIKVNGVAAYTTTPPTSYPTQRAWGMNFNWCTNWISGNNEVVVHVKAFPGLLSNCQVMGMKVLATCGSSIPYVNLTGPNPLCANSPGQYIAPTKTALGLSSGAPITYSWSKPSSFGLGAGNSPVSNQYNVTSGTQSGMIGVGILSLTPNGYSCLYTGGYSVTVPPQLTITPSATMVCSGDCITLVASGAQSYVWTAGNNNPIGTGPSLVACPTQNTTYKVTGTTASGCTYTKTIFIPVSQKPIVIANTTGTVFCQGLGIGMWPGGNAASYKWQPGNITAIINTPITFFPTQSTVYSLIGTSATGCTTTKNVNVVVNPKPNLTVAATPSTICSGNSTNLTASGATNYLWQPGGSNLASIVVSPTVITVYTVTGSFTTGCTSSKTVAVLVNPSPTVIVNPPSICPGITNILTAIGAPPNSFTWTIFGTPINTVIPNTPTIAITATACTNVQVCGKAANGCIKCTTLALCPGAPVPLTISNPTICASSAPCTTLSVSSPVTFTSTWLQNSQSIGSGTSVVVCPSSSAVYVVSVTPTGTTGCPATANVAVAVQTNCCSQSTTGLTQINGLGGNFSSNSYLLNSSMTLTANTTFQNSEVWITPGVQITVPSGYTLNLEHAHLFGCSNTMWQGIKILDGGAVHTPSTAVNPATSMIEDAVIGMELDNIVTEPSVLYMPILIEGVVFNKNRIGIRISNSTPTLTSLSLGINGCVFSSRNLQYTTFPAIPTWSSSSMTGGGMKVPSSPTATAGLLPPYVFLNAQQAVLKAPYGNQPGHIGIQIENIGDPTDPSTQAGMVYIGVIPAPSISGDFNLFDGIGTGIEISEAGLTSQNLVFQNMQVYPFNTPTGFYGGNAINHSVSSLRNLMLQLTPVAGGIYGMRAWDCVKGINAESLYNLYVTKSMFRSSQSVTGWLNPNIPGQYGIYSNTNRFYHYVHSSEFNNVQVGFSLNTPTVNPPPFYDMTGNNLTSGVYADLLYVDQNYFGPEVLSSTAYSGGNPNTSETMFEAVQILASNQNGANWFVSPQNPGIKNANILYNRMDRVYRGVRIEGMDDCPLAVEGNSVYVEDDYTFGSPGNPFFGYGISLTGSTDNKTISTNTLEAMALLSPNNNVSLVYCERNQGIGSPNVHCNFTTNSHFGFQFEGSNAGTIWSANHMCNEFGGLALTNSAVIGTQGTPAIGCDNFWEFGAPNCNQWVGGGLAAFETYVENSDASQSQLFVVPLAGFSPASNFDNNGLGYNQGGAVQSPGGIVHLQANLDCAQNNTAYVPSWRLQNTNNTASKDNKNLFEDDAIKLYPNPTNSNLNVFYADAAGTCTIRIIDLRGQVVYSDSFKGGVEYQVDLSTVPASVYIVVLQKENKIIRKKLIKTN